jgi:hypothetical protein
MYSEDMYSDLNCHKAEKYTKLYLGSVTKTFTLEGVERNYPSFNTFKTLRIVTFGIPL